jgi:hypothetical protein
VRSEAFCSIFAVEWTEFCIFVYEYLFTSFVFLQDRRAEYCMHTVRRMKHFAIFFPDKNGQIPGRCVEILSPKFDTKFENDYFFHSMMKASKNAK